MSTRYVWEKSTASISVSFPIVSGNTNSILSPVSHNPEFYLCTSYDATFFEGTSKVKFSPSGSYIKLSSSDAGKAYLTSTYMYAIEIDPYKNTSIIIKYVSSGKYWILFHTTIDGEPYYRLGNYKDTAGTAVDSGCGGLPTIKKNAIGKASSPNSAEYPESGQLNNFFYDYLGSDNIDPISITYPASITYENEDTKLSYEIKPSTSNVYGGTIEYKKDSRKNGGAWDATTSDWRTNLTGSYSGFDETTQTYQLQVHARDGWGFESSTYITGPVCTFTKKLVLSLSVSPANSGTVTGAGEYSSGTYATVTATPANGWEFVGWTENGTTVSTSATYTFTITVSRNLTAVFKQKLTAWVGVNGKARKGVAMYVGVNGKARKVTAAYIGVNGKARRFL